MLCVVAYILYYYVVHLVPYRLLCGYYAVIMRLLCGYYAVIMLLLCVLCGYYAVLIGCYRRKRVT